ncbi:MAG: LUD domain-containing protein, partial [Ruthenibacterium sp.]
MDTPRETVTRLRMERTAAALRKNNMEAYCVDTAAEVVPLVRTLLQEGDVVAAGGGMSLTETNVLDLLNSGAYQYLNRSKPGLTKDEIGKIYRDTFSA